MKQGRDIQALAAEIARRNETKRDYVADTRGLEMVPRFPATGETKVPMLDIHNSDGSPAQTGLTLTDHTHRQVQSRLKIAAPYYDRMRAEAPELLATNVNHWFQEKPERRMVRTLDGNARAFLSDQYWRIDDYDVAQIILPVLGDFPTLTVKSCDVTDRSLYIKAYTQEAVGEVRRGEQVGAGIVITNSEIGLGRYSLAMFVEVLVCTNGMKAMDLLSKTHLGGRVGSDQIEALLADDTKRIDDQALMMKTRDVVRGVLQGAMFEDYLQKLRDASEERIEGHPARAVEILGETVGLNEAEQGGVLRHLIEGGDLSRWGIANAITRESQDVGDYDRASEMEVLGGKVIDLKPTDWQAIAVAA